MSSLHLTTNTAFRHRYEFVHVRELLGADFMPHYYYPGASSSGGHDGIMVKCRPKNGEAWLGTFAFGTMTPKGISGIFTTPDPTRICVVAKGEGYLVTANAPQSWDEVESTPIIDVRTVPAQNINVFAEFTGLVAYGAEGLKWKTKRLSWDNLTITEATDNYIQGEFWDIREEAKSGFVVDLKTGEHEGGID